jgi:hypothetical protein
VPSGSSNVAQNYPGMDQNGAPPLELFSYPPSYQLSGGTSPFQIAFTSSSLSNPIACGGSQTNPIDCFTTVLVYKLNSNST